MLELLNKHPDIIKPKDPNISIPVTDVNRNINQPVQNNTKSSFLQNEVKLFKSGNF